MYLEMSDKVNLYVQQSGNGIPCIFIHGGPGGCSYDFEILGGNSLEGFMKLIYFDQRGSGRSEGDKDSNGTFIWWNYCCKLCQQISEVC